MFNDTEKVNNTLDCNSKQENEQLTQIDSLYDDTKEAANDEQTQDESEQESIERRTGQDRRCFAYRTGIQNRRSGRDRRKKRSKQTDN